MKITPLKVSDPWFRRMLAETSPEHRQMLRGVPIESTVQMEFAELRYESEGQNYRPYLHLRGEVLSAVPQTELPYGIDELPFVSGSGLPLDIYYDFSDVQLAELVTKGYFSEGFKVPQEMVGIPWAIPTAADFLIVAPEQSDQPPVVFMSVQDSYHHGMTEENSGYVLSKYFEDHTVSAEQRAKELAAQESAPERTDVNKDMFANEKFIYDYEQEAPDEVHSVEASAAVLEQELADLLAVESEFDLALTTREVASDGIFARLVQEIQISQEDLSEIAPEHLEQTESSVERKRIVQERIRQGVERTVDSIQGNVNTSHAAIEDQKLRPNDAQSEGHRVEGFETPISIGVTKEPQSVTSSQTPQQPEADSPQEIADIFADESFANETSTSEAPVDPEKGAPVDDIQRKQEEQMARERTARVQALEREHEARGQARERRRAESDLTL